MNKLENQEGRQITECQKWWDAILTREVREHLTDKVPLSKDIKATWKFGVNVFQAEGLDSAKSCCLASLAQSGRKATARMALCLEQRRRVVAGEVRQLVG